jgi:DNA-binding MarR family transcriptional regulator
MKALTPTQMQLLQMLVAGKSYVEAAEELGISSKTIQRWMTQPHIAEAYRQLRENIADYIRLQIEQLATKAIKALDDSLECEAPAVRLKASQLVLDRLSPAQVAQQQTEQQQNAMDAALLAYLSDEEMQQFNRLLELARERKREAEESKVTPLRRQA